ncbi:MIP/aquaporin family protein [Staphylococcus massiliensis]|uniref:Glycerol uptake facilitator n=1 Tax=Staphylococcus massiliensis S46 TaxID=1229783 RepID=K9AT96_9STAP|nr:MIP/aquaporin family protein [Staphylococcus massiliensis]EKU50519.1 glycerol uptake facilitator [Staphylococcus massiliensis S46]MCG3398710.1 aquaporin family protein [Staphylococcus massiliensis]MCG3401271.1 aquaporin family protein [Staphylococcus massiliensis]MCG3412552.1 aquaporin family protein [Staphylococcus massiliensis]POA00389.1 aquaporin family protein [Staphylococcus massiliensis CCUG 55927]
MSVYLAELIGTAILILFGGGVVANVVLKASKGNGADWIVISVGWGLAVTMGVYAVGQISGAHLNPAVSIGLAMDGALPWAQVPGYILAQIAGGTIGGILVWLMYLPHWKATEDKGAKLAVFSTDPALTNYFANMISEIIGTAALVSGLMYIGVNKFSDGLNPLVVGALIIAIGLSLGGPTGYAINPARDLGPRIAHAILPIAGKGDSNWKYAIVPILGPIAGGMLGSAIYRMLFKGTFDVFSILAIVVVIIALVVGILMNKKSDSSEIAKIN